MTKRSTHAWGVGINVGRGVVTSAGIALGVALAACGSDATGTGTGASTAGDAGASTTVASAKTGVVSFVITRSPTATTSAPLSVGAFTENPPKSRPPVVFDTSKSPTFPYAGSLKELEPGRYWIVAVLDLPPVTLGGLKPGPEDILVTSEAVDIVGGDTHDVTLTLPDAPPTGDAVDASTHD